MVFKQISLFSQWYLQNCGNSLWKVILRFILRTLHWTVPVWYFWFPVSYMFDLDPKTSFKESANWPITGRSPGCLFITWIFCMNFIPWPTVTSQPIRLSTNFMTLMPSLTFTDYEWFPWSICNGCGMPAGKLTLPDTLFSHPLWDLFLLQLLRPDSSNLPCLYSTFRLEYPLVLPRFWL